MKSIAVIGAGGVAKGVYQILRDINTREPSWEVLGFIDENAALHGQLFCGKPIISSVEWLIRKPGIFVVIAIANPCQRKQVFERISSIVDDADAFATLVHPAAWLAHDVSVGKGVVIYPGVCINSMASIGNHVIINMRSSIGHDAIINDFVTIAPGVSISGASRLSVGVDVGTNAAVLQKLSIGSWSRVGAGAVVINDMPAGITCVGVPARVVRTSL